MKILKLVDVLFFENLYWVKYSVLTPKGTQEIRSISFRNYEDAKNFHKNIKNKIYV